MALNRNDSQMFYEKKKFVTEENVQEVLKQIEALGIDGKEKRFYRKLLLRQSSAKIFSSLNLSGAYDERGELTPLFSD